MFNETVCAWIGICNLREPNYEYKPTISRPCICTAALGHKIDIPDHSHISLASQLSLAIQPLQTQKRELRYADPKVQMQGFQKKISGGNSGAVL